MVSNSKSMGSKQDYEDNRNQMSNCDNIHRFHPLISFGWVDLFFAFEDEIVDGLSKMIKLVLTVGKI